MVKELTTDNPRPTTKKMARMLSTRHQKAVYAVFTTGGKQYRVMVGDKVKIEKLGDGYKEGDKLTFDKVLLVDDGESEATIGTPYIKGAVINATLDKIARYKTIDVI